MSPAGESDLCYTGQAFQEHKSRSCQLFLRVSLGTGTAPLGCWRLLLPAITAPTESQGEEARKGHEHGRCSPPGATLKQTARVTPAGEPGGCLGADWAERVEDCCRQGQWYPQSSHGSGAKELLSDWKKTSAAGIQKATGGCLQAAKGQTTPRHCTLLSDLPCASGETPRETGLRKNISKNKEISRKRDRERERTA